MNSATARAAKTTEGNRLGPAGEVGKHKTVPPQAALTMGAETRLGPREKSSKECNILDVNGNRQYQFINSLQGLLLLPGGSNGALFQPHYSTSF